MALSVTDHMLTSSNWSIFRVIDPLWGETKGHRLFGYNFQGCWLAVKTENTRSTRIDMSKTIYARRTALFHEVIFNNNMWLLVRGNKRPVLSAHYSDVIMGAMASQITSVSIVYSTVCSGSEQRKHQSSASLAFVRGIHRSPVTPHTKGQ